MPQFRFYWFILAVQLIVRGAALGQTADTGGRTSAMAGAGVALPGEVWTALNPATIAGATGRCIAFQGSQAFGMQELRQAKVSLVWPFPLFALSAEAGSFGFSSFRTTSAKLSVGGRVSDIGGGLLLGASLAAHSVTVEGYGGASAVTINLGWIMTPLPGLSVGGSVDNIHSGRWMQDEELPQVIRVGAAYFSERMTIAVDLEKDQMADASVRVGAEFAAVDAFRIRSGAATAPTRIGMGIGLKVAMITVDLAAERHQLLGWTPAVAMAVSF